MVVTKIEKCPVQTFDIRLHIYEFLTFGPLKNFPSEN